MFTQQVLLLPACSLVSLLTHPPPILISLSSCLGVTSRTQEEEEESSKCSSKPNNRSDSPTAAASLLDTGHHWLTRQQACFTSVSLRITLPLLLKITPQSHSHSSPPEKLFKVTSANGQRENPRVAKSGGFQPRLLLGTTAAAPERLSVWW